MAWSPDGRRIASASHDNTIRIWDATEPTKLLPHTKDATCVSYAPDGTGFISGSDDDTLRVWDPHSHTQRAITTSHQAKPRAITHSPSGEHVASATSDCRVRIWDANTLEHVRTLAGHTRDATCVAYSPDGKLLASGSADRTSRLWNPATGEHLATAKHEDWVNCVAFSPDGTKLASGSSFFDIQIWSIPTLAKLLEINAHSNYVNGIAWYPSGDRFVSSSWDCKLRVWNANDGGRIHELVGHTAPVRGLAFAPDGTRFASVSDDKTLRIWDAQTYEQLEQFRSETPLRRVAWSPDSAQVIAGSTAGVQVWRLEPCLAILQTHGEIGLAQTPSGQFCLQPESAEAYLEVPRPDRAAVFYLPLAGIRDHQSREAVARSLAGQPTRSLAQSLGWAPLPWDGEIRSISVDRPPPSPLTIVSTQFGDIITNPFSPDTALRNVDTLPGRRVEIDEVVQVLRRRGVAWLRGPRRAGKTSFLNYLVHHSPGCQVFSRSLQAGPAQTPDDIASLLAPKLGDAPNSAAAFVELLHEHKAPVIILDEIAVLAEAQAGTLRWLRALGNEDSAITLIYSGSHYDWVQVRERMREVPGSSFGNDVTFVDFGPIPEPDALEFLTATAPAQAPISATLASWVVQECGTWPYYLQVLGYALVQEQTVHQRTPATMSRGDFQDFYRRVLLRAKATYFELRWQEFTPRAREVLRAGLAAAREHRRLSNPTDLTDAEKRVMRDQGALADGSWVIDKPFLNWMHDNIETLGEPQS
ncbi:WD domain, G-beta repeat protein [Enhygromyxa salina]|uniref:WD domain, G-beta repeat protein n=1 Tax=Enhygromyxa salina TaxID=215803 RepID=A0A2S9YUP8_9BACT|nr:WD domain, G-beta repeat protein [Enhygromyxa salina]